MTEQYGENLEYGIPLEPKAESGEQTPVEEDMEENGMEEGSYDDSDLTDEDTEEQMQQMWDDWYQDHMLAEGETEPLTQGQNEKAPEITPEIRKSWETAFDLPKGRTLPTKYCYLITSVNAGQSLLALQNIEKAQFGNADSLRDKAEGSLMQEEFVSAQVVSEEHPDRFGAQSLIIRAPIENVVTMHTDDAGTGFGSERNLQSMGPRQLMTIDELLAKTGVNNEVVLRGSTDAGNIVVLGIVAHKDDYYARDVSQRLEMPLLIDN